jgi:hypothetical protein
LYTYQNSYVPKSSSKSTRKQAFIQMKGAGHVNARRPSVETKLFVDRNADLVRLGPHQTIAVILPFVFVGSRSL